MDFKRGSNRMTLTSNAPIVLLTINLIPFHIMVKNAICITFTLQLGVLQAVKKLATLSSPRNYRQVPSGWT